MIKKLFVVMIVLIVVLVGVVSYHLSSYFDYKKDSALVLMYHGVGNEPVRLWGDMLIKPDLFNAQMEYLQQRKYKVISLEELAKRFRSGDSVEKCVAITFDDGYSNNYEYAFPILKKYGATATFYVIHNTLGTEGYLKDSEVREMYRAGMKIGSHTLTHQKLAEITDNLLQREVAGSKMLLGQRFEEIVVESISFPNGVFSQKVIDSCVAAGYKEGVSGINGVNRRESFLTAPFVMCRVGIYDKGDGVDGFARRLEKAYLNGYLKYKGFDVEKIRGFVKKIFR